MLLVHFSSAKSFFLCPKLKLLIASVDSMFAIEVLVDVADVSFDPLAVLNPFSRTLFR